jgi:hypothetical protein
MFSGPLKIKRNIKGNTKWAENYNPGMLTILSEQHDSL